ncbi:MAG: hypothetical protein IPG56_11170, partial [Caulobacteraceae bacterium]|nr:hypothetical protein [Caulobacteraceae bacterium]
MKLPTDKGEVKGKQLSAAHLRTVTDFLARYPVLFDATAIDPGMHTAVGIEAHRTDQAQRVTVELDRYVHQSMRDDLTRFRATIEAMSPQLYMQAVVTFELLHRVTQLAPLYYAQRTPDELAAFRWVVDAKDPGGATDWERWWAQMVLEHAA